MPGGKSGADRDRLSGAGKSFCKPAASMPGNGRNSVSGKMKEICPGLSECDFGDFENKNYLELSHNPDYQAWVDSNGTLPFPNGESRESFRWRTLEEFNRIVEECFKKEINTAALVVHGGTIMNIMEAYGSPARDFYDWHVKNGRGYLVQTDRTLWKKKILNLIKEL